MLEFNLLTRDAKNLTILKLSKERLFEKAYSSGVFEWPTKIIARKMWNLETSRMREKYTDV